jgi:hypothetical protein
MAVTILLSGNPANADFCSDLKFAFSKSGGFSDLRGAAIRDRYWTAKIGFGGADECNIRQEDDGTYSLGCVLKKYPNKAEAEKVFSKVLSDVKKCIPGPEFSYSSHEMEDVKSVHFISLEPKLSGSLMMNELPTCAAVCGG